jgi:hypothetical protein
MDIVERVAARAKQAGSASFEVFIKNKDPKRAFQQAVDDARYESGHGGYSGTISEKDSFTIRQRDPMSMSAARTFAHKDIDRNDKWGPAFAIPVGEAKTGKPVRRGLVVEAGDQWDAQHKAQAQAQALFDKEPKSYGEIKILSVKPKEDKTPLRAKAKTFQKKSEFYWQRSMGHTSGKTYDSKRDAIEAFKKMDPRVPKIREEWSLVERKVVAAFEITKAAKQEFEVIVEATPELRVGPTIGWYFYGYASF